jgi:RES domain-containing protein
MSYDPEHYRYDRYFRSCTASIGDGAVLYRITTPIHSDPTFILNGRGAKRTVGRFNEPGQETSYCANNCLGAVAEMLFHLYRKALDVIAHERDPDLIRRAVDIVRVLVIFRTEHIDDLIHIEYEDVANRYGIALNGRNLRGTAAVHPDATYPLYTDLNRKLRLDGKSGIMYPSARHSRDLCFAIYDDKSSAVKPFPYLRVPIRLHLISEEIRQLKHVHFPDPTREKLHPTKGYYQFTDESAYDNAVSSGLLNPQHVPKSGLIDFVRKTYSAYPKDAVA